jgi:hypothetical protein
VVAQESVQAGPGSVAPSLAALAWNPASFEAWAYAGRFATKGDRLNGWAEYVQLHTEAVDTTFDKGQGPGVMHGISKTGGRQAVDVSHSTALAIDIDTDALDPGPFFALCDWLKSQDITYLAQWRDAGHTYKLHLVLPLAQPYPVYDTKVVREYRIELIDRLLSKHYTPDYAPATVNQLLYAYTARPGALNPDQEWHTGTKALDMVGMYPPSAQGGGRVRRQLGTEADATVEATALRKVLQVSKWVASKGAWDVKCPVDHGDDYQSKTYLYPNGYISCMAGKCQGKPTAWFVSHLPDDMQREVLDVTAQKVKAALAARDIQHVSLAQAEDRINTALHRASPVERHATCIMVSTGAGKTRAIARHLNQYSAPYEGESDSSGKTAVLAMPTNALLDEVRQRLDIPHRRMVGVLAVLDDGGNPACKKYEQARRLQEAGGNVHRLLCAHCEYKEGCAAREGTKTGTGSLIATNHSLMTTAATEFHGKGRHPLLVWDESPKWVQTATLENRDIEWLLREFDKEAKPTKDYLSSMIDVRLFSDRYRTAVRPLLEIVRQIIRLPVGQYRPETIANEWIKTPYNKTVLYRAAAVVNMPSTAAWNDIVDVFSQAYRLNSVEMGFDGMRADTQARVLKAERILDALEVLSGEDCVAHRAEHHVVVAALTKDASLFREYGGVVLDATANVAELNALRPDLSLTRIHVQDGGPVERYAMITPGLSRTALAANIEPFSKAIQKARKAVERWAKTQNIKTPKVAVFTYRDRVEVVKTQWSEADVAYFGNTRGYDRWFQEGFDAFVTIGDPISNLGSLALQWLVLTGKEPVAGDPAFQDYVAASAESEAAQAHGRARDPQAKLGAGGRLHLHYGTRVPAGWALSNCQIESAP